MKVETPNTGEARASQGKIVFGKLVEPWSPEDMERLRSIASGMVTTGMIEELFPDRGVKSVKCKLGQVRAEMGISKRYVARHEGGDHMRLPVLDPEDDGMDDGEYQARRRTSARSNALFLAAFGERCYG